MKKNVLPNSFKPLNIFCILNVSDMLVKYF